MRTSDIVRIIGSRAAKKIHLLIAVLWIVTCLSAWAESRAIFMDGRYDDWEGLASLYQDASGDQGGGDIDFSKIWICNDSERLFIRFEIGSEHNLQRENSIYLYIDSDNNSSTGYSINGIGADFSIAFGERQGRLYNSGIAFFELNEIGMLQSPSVSATEFEIALSRNATYYGTPFFRADTIKLQLVNNIVGAHDQAPDSGQTLSYTFDETPVPPYDSIPLSKEEDADIRVLTYNVLSDGLFLRTDTFTRILQALQPDIINFQEIYSHSASQTATIIEAILPSGPGQQWYANRAFDCVTVSKYPISNHWEIETNLAVLINLPDANYPKDLFIINSHLPAGDNDVQRQQECDSIMAFIRDFETAGGIYDLPSDTPVVHLGDMNLVGYAQQLTTLLTGDIADEATYGPDFSPDWDGSSLTDVLACHTATRDSYTWRRDTSSFTPGRLDYIIFSDSVVEVRRNFALWTETMSPEDLAAYGLQASDTRNASDHLPVVADFRFPTPTPTPTPSPTPTPTPSPTPGQIFFDFVSDQDEWTTGGAPVVFSEPDFVWQPDYLKITSLTNTNTFGFWQSPQDAIPADSDYLYRARFTVSTDITDQPLVPQIRLRANSLNLQQYDVLSIESAGDGGASPDVAGTDYDLYFVPPANDTAAMLSFDVLNFNPDDAAVAELSLDTVTVDRFALDALSTPTVVQDYDFELSQDGWTTGGAPIVFSPPQYIYSSGALELRAIINTNTFGFWGNHPADITIEADKLYRGTFEIRTDVTNSVLVPEMRLRYNTGNLQASHTFGISSTGDGANSPGTTNTTYDRLYFLPPANCVGEDLLISFDMLNFNPGDAPTASLILDRAIIETLSPPALP